MLSIITNNLGKIGIGLGVAAVSGGGYWFLRRKFAAKTERIITLRSERDNLVNELELAKAELRAAHEEAELTAKGLEERLDKLVVDYKAIIDEKSRQLEVATVELNKLKVELDEMAEELRRTKEVAIGQEKYIEELSAKSTTKKSNAATPKKKAKHTAERAPVAQAG